MSMFLFIFVCMHVAGSVLFVIRAGRLRICIDLFGTLPVTSHGYTHILVVLVEFTKFTYLTYKYCKYWR